MLRPPVESAQYAAEAYRQSLAPAHITPSMSRKDNCWDNAPMESFLHTLKTERVHHRVYATRDQARRDLYAYIKGFYNSHRPHSAVGYSSPAEMERAQLNPSTFSREDHAAGSRSAPPYASSLVP
jgi:transposase InsO family protein